MTSYPIDSSSLELCLLQSFCLFPFVEGFLLLALNLHWNKPNKIGRFQQTWMCHNGKCTRKMRECQTLKQCNWPNISKPWRAYTAILQRINLHGLKHAHTTWSWIELFSPEEIWKYRTIPLLPYFKGDYSKHRLKY